MKQIIVLLVCLCGTSLGAQISSENAAFRQARYLEGIKNAPSFRESLGRSLNSETDNCTEVLGEELVNKISSYQDIVDTIISKIVEGDFKGKTYDELAKLVDRYPIRQSGFKNLEDSIDYMMERMEALGLENVRGEQVLVPHWVRGEEVAELQTPHKKRLPMLGLGTTVGTSKDGITAPVLVVKSFEELDSKKDQAKGRIVVYNQGWLGTYGQTNIYRTRGASHASQYGAVATLIQSVGDFSLHTPHTGGQTYWENVTHIPTACITMEDADFLYRLQEKNEDLTIHIKMLNYNLPLTTSRNAIGEIKGQSTPTEYVALSGHIDSWDVGQGAMDDGGGVMISVMALAALKELGLTPNRTLQAILWTSEEVGLWGVADFARQHKDILPDYSVVFESDSGTFKPRGLDFAGSHQAGCIVNEVLKLAKSINATDYARMSRVSSDITKLQDEGVPGLSLNNENDRYFWYHHTEADSITMINSADLDLDTALFALASYVLADLPMKLPRDAPEN